MAGPPPAVPRSGLPRRRLRGARCQPRRGQPRPSWSASARRCSTTATGSPTASRPSWSRCRSWPTTGWTRTVATATCCSPWRRSTRTPCSSRCASSCGAPGGSLVLRWMVDGYSRGSETATSGRHRPQPARLQGRHGEPRARRHRPDGRPRVGRRVGDGEPDVDRGRLLPRRARVIRMFVEFWDRTPLAEQEAIIGRHKVSGAPLGREQERRRADLRRRPERRGHAGGRAHPAGQPAHPGDRGEPRSCAAASPTPAASTAAGQLDQGLAFVCYQRSLNKGFLAVQTRLAGEPLEEYILPVGGGYFFALPGVPSPDRHLADALLA